MKAKVSVIIPVYNAALTIERTMQSVEAQHYPPGRLEVILVNDGSTDRTADVLRQYAPKYRVLHTPNGGVSAAREKGLSVATGDYIQYLDSDDLLAEGKLEVQVEALARHGADVAYGDWEKFREDAAGHLVTLERISRRLEGRPEVATFTDFWCPPAALLYSRSITRKIGAWNRSLPIIQDARYLWDAAARGARFVYTPGLAAGYRVSEGQSLSTRYGKVKVTADIFENARQVYGHWQNDLGGDPEKKAALLRVLFQCSKLFYEHDRQKFEECLLLLRQVGGRDFIPAQHYVLRAVSTLLGYKQAEFLALQYRRFKGKLNRNGHEIG